jgi:hypothetical protein
MASAGTVTVDFAAETARFTAELKKVNAQLGGIKDQLGAVDKAARVAFRFFTAGALIAFTKSAFAAADATADMAERAGIAVESFSRLQFAASQTDVEMQALTSGIQKFQVTLSKASTGSKEAQATLQLFGVTAESLANLRVEQQIAAIAEAFKDVRNPADRTRLAVELFGRSAGPQLVPLLAQGEEGIRKLLEQADRLGVTMSGTTALAIDEADKALKRLSATAKAAVTGALGLLALALNPPGTKEGKLVVEIARLEEKIRLLNKDIEDGPETGIFDRLFGTDTASDVENLKQANDQLVRLQDQLRALRGESAAAQLNNLLPLPWLDQLQLIDVAKIEAMKINVDELAQELVQFDRVVQEIRQRRVTDVLEISTQDVIAQQVGVEQLVTAELQKELDKRAAATQIARTTELEQERTLQQSLQDLRSGTVNAAIGALQSFAGHSKKAAIALVLINKARAIASVIQDTAAAAVKAIAVYGPTPAGFAAAATAKAFGAAQIALIAASGLGEIQQINRSGGAPIGSPSNPINTTSQLDQTQSGATPRSAVTVIVQGNVIGNQQFIDDLIDDIRDAVDDKDVILIRPTSRNAQELVGA